jgi:hypothetical protein
MNARFFDFTCGVSQPTWLFRFHVPEIKGHCAAIVQPLSVRARAIVFIRGPLHTRHDFGINPYYAVYEYQHPSEKITTKGDQNTKSTALDSAYKNAC